MAYILYLLIASIVAGAWVFWKRSYYDKDYGDFDAFELFAAVLLGVSWPLSFLPTVAIQAAKYMSNRRKR